MFNLHKLCCQDNFRGHDFADRVFQSGQETIIFLPNMLVRKKRQKKLILEIN